MYTTAFGSAVYRPQGINKGVSQINADINIWKPPPHGFLKLNINEESKGNPGLVGFGGVIRDEQRHIKEVFYSTWGRPIIIWRNSWP